VLTNLGSFYAEIQDLASAEKAFQEAWDQTDAWSGDHVYFGDTPAAQSGCTCSAAHVIGRMFYGPQNAQPRMGETQSKILQVLTKRVNSTRDLTRVMWQKSAT